MSLEKTEAILLKLYNWSESSRTAVFFSRSMGRIALVDKGGRSFKSKRGRIHTFSILEITFYNSEKESNGYISEIELVEQFSLEKDGSLGRLAYASAGCELLNQLLPEEEPQESIYTYFKSYFEKMDRAKKQYLPAVFVTFFLRILSQLGYHPSFEYCVGCNKEIIIAKTKTDFNLSAQRGGVVCETCQKVGDCYIPLSLESLKMLQVLQKASLNEAETLPIGYRETSLLLEILEMFLNYQSELKSKLKSLEFLEKLKQTKLS